MTERGGGGGRGCVSEVAAAAACSHAPTDDNLLKFNALFTADWPQFMAPPQGRVEMFACGGRGVVGLCLPLSVSSAVL